MQQQDGHSAAEFYAKLVDLSSYEHGHVTVASYEHDGAQEQQPLPQQLAGAVHSSDAVQQHAHQVADGATQQHAGAAAAQGSVPFRPVKFSQPVVLDPNTGMMTLPPKAAADASATPAGGGAGGGAASTYSSSKGQSSWHTSSRSRASQPDINTQASRYQQSSSTQAFPTALSAVGASSKRPIERSNIGFKLLQKAGWQEGQGLGAQEQGMAAPLQAIPNKGNKGLGFAPHQQQQPQQQQNAVLHQQAGSSTVDTKQAAVAGPVLGSKRVAALVAAELATEDIDAKVKRHRQVLQQEAKDKRDKAIQQYLYRAFGEVSDYGTGDGNPLGKNHRLTATNPLLD